MTYSRSSHVTSETGVDYVYLYNKIVVVNIRLNIASAVDSNGNLFAGLPGCNSRFFGVVYDVYKKSGGNSSFTYAVNVAPYDSSTANLQSFNNSIPAGAFIIGQIIYVSK